MLGNALVDPAIQLTAFDARTAADLKELQAACLSLAIELGAAHTRVVAALTQREQAPLVNRGGVGLQT